VDVVDQWTAAHATALQHALRLTTEEFHDRSGIAVRTIAEWHRQPAIVPRREFQQVLDEMLDRAPPSAHARFDALLHRAASTEAAQVLRVAIAVVTAGDRVLLVCRRGDDAIRWQFPAGVVKPGGRPETVAARETLAETGVHIAVHSTLGERVHPITGAACVYLACSYLAGEASNLDVEENLDVMWVGRDAVVRFIPPDTIYPPILALLEGTTA
jgi:8-oxo-dGTP diphosphatase